MYKIFKSALTESHVKVGYMRKTLSERHDATRFEQSQRNNGITLPVHMVRMSM